MNNDVLKITVKIAKSNATLREFNKKYTPMDSNPTTLKVRKKLIPTNFGILKKNISPKILLEFAPFSLQECDYAPKNLLLFLKNLGFELNEIDSKGNLLKIDIDFITRHFTR